MCRASGRALLIQRQVGVGGPRGRRPRRDRRGRATRCREDRERVKAVCVAEFADRAAFWLYARFRSPFTVAFTLPSESPEARKIRYPVGS